jgi:hypothetical protein
MNKHQIKFFSAFYVDKLYRNVAATENYDNYLSKQFVFEEKYAKGPTGIFIDREIKLDPEKSDLANSITLYEALKGLDEVQASDERLWTYLTHVHFWEYMKGRWPIEDSKKPLSRIRERYFLRNLNLESLTRNGLSRLWWYAHITLDTHRKNKYELLEILLQRQDLVVGITERAIGSNKKIRTSLLEYLKENPSIAESEDLSRELIKTLNLYGGVKILPFLEISDIKKLLSDLGSTIAA